MRKKRNEADYNLRIRKTLRESEECVMDAEMFQRQLLVVVQKISPEIVLKMEEIIRSYIKRNDLI